MHLSELLDITRLDNLVDQGYISVTEHPDGGLRIYNYTDKAQYDWRCADWPLEARLTRGLIVDHDNIIVARPFPKIFNWDEWSGQIPSDGEYRVMEKMDGCFPYQTPLRLWGGGVVRIGDVVTNRLQPILEGMDQRGEIVPCTVVDWFDNGTKNNWLDVTVDCLVVPTSGAGGHPNRLRVTTNHHVWVNGNYTSADNIRPGDHMLTSHLDLSPSVHHMIRSSLLGDGAICLSASSQKVANYQEGHNHPEYVEYIRGWLGECGVDASDTTSGYGSPLQWAQSKHYHTLYELRQEWYPDGKKIVPEDLSWVDEFTIAKWYMDDGSLAHSDLQQDRALFATNGFSFGDVQRLADLLTKFFDVSCSVYESRGWCLRINAGRHGEIERFWRTITPHIIPALRYKVPEQYRQIPYRTYRRGFERHVTAPVRVLAVSTPVCTKRNFPSGRKGFDIRTTTSNYFAKGVLVHNSLGIAYRAPSGEVCIATRGSFSSDQARWATEHYQSRYAGCFIEQWMDRYTFLFEIIYPENQIVVHYGDTKDLFCLAAIENATGQDNWSLVSRFSGPHVQDYPVADLRQLKEVDDQDNREGFVVAFSNGLRLKVKFDEYVRLHRIITNVSTKTIWEYLKEGRPLEDLLDRVPDEFYTWMHDTVDFLTGRYANIERHAQAEFARVISRVGRSDRRAFAMEVADSPVKPVLFKMLDAQPYSDFIWRQIQPSYSRPFKNLVEASA